MALYKVDHAGKTYAILYINELSKRRCGKLSQEYQLDYFYISASKPSFDKRDTCYLACNASEKASKGSHERCMISGSTTDCTNKPSYEITNHTCNREDDKLCDIPAWNETFIQAYDPGK